MRTIAIIPARYASSRFPGKPLIDIAGKTMIERVYSQSKKAFKNVCVATDDSRIFDKVKEFGGEVVMTSPDHNSGTDRCFEAYNTYLADHPELHFDLIMNIQGDEPLIDPVQLLALEAAFKEPQVTIGTMAKKITSPSELFNGNIPKLIVDKYGFAIYFSRNVIPHIRDLAQIEWLSSFPFFKHIGLYAYRPESLSEICRLEPSMLEKAEKLEQLRWLENGLKIKVIESFCETYAIDTPSDLEKLIQLLSKKIE